MRCTPSGVATVPEGSKSNVEPSRFTRDIIETTSSLVDVTTLGIRVMSKFGMINDEVFPLRLGPNTNVDRSCPLIASPDELLPR